MKSIINNGQYCYVCGKPKNHTHHCIFGSKRALADKDGLTVPLCAECHNLIHTSSDPFYEGIQLDLKRIAQRKWEEKNGTREDFIKRYGRNYLD